MSLEPNPHMTTSQQQQLPDEIIIDVLVRLRVKPLLRCKSVSKSWYSFISDPLFVKSHLTKSISNTEYVNHRLLMLTTKPDININTCSLYDVLYDHKSISTISEELEYPLKEHGKHFSVIGCCNGLFCIVTGQDNVFIWNPSTRKSIKLPNCDSEPWDGWYGFGYDKSSDDYKVVALDVGHNDGNEFESKVRIYSMKTGKWKIVRDFPCCLPTIFSCAFSNGAFHWRVNGYESFTSEMIVSLDLATETYSVVCQPGFDRAINMNMMLTFGALGEWLCITCSYNRSRTDVWVMNSKDSWTKLVSIPHPTDSHFYHVSMPLCILNDGKLLLRMNEEFGLYDPSDNSFLKIQNFNRYLGVYVFVENLVSLDGVADNNDDEN